MTSNASIYHQVFRFILSGALNTGATFVLYWGLLFFLNYQVAYAISFIAGIALSYALNTRFVFKASHSWLKLALFPLVYACTYVAGAVVLRLVVGHLHVDQRIGPLVSVCVTLPLSFLLSRLVLLKTPSR